MLPRYIMMIINVNRIHLFIKMYIKVGSGCQIPIFLYYTLGEKLDLLLVNNFFFFL